jgi:dienelactone hydrolase
MHKEALEYFDEDTMLSGFLAYDKSYEDQRPAVMVVHDWSGCNEFACKKAEEIALELGYVGFALDMYGNAKIGNTHEEKTQLMQPLLQNRSLLRKRILAGFNALKKIAVVDTQKIAVIGFCFGGLCALDLARSGADAKGVVSFHGLLNAPEAIQNERITAKILALHGYEDPMVPPELVNSFAREMTEAGADWQINMYGNTKHAFTNPVANDQALGLVYNTLADQRSWIAMKCFFAEIFK